ncbi:MULTISPECIES: phage holin family protein [Flavobacterium]|uniref:Phage holin family protein n=1 Tax=Flavobacterium aurantiibacter TaxID=2023067 RepID=A0A255ZJA5_9FLAO|nr:MULTISPECIES: phage holin family protein [Flavobacterium]OYQ41502.1 hypothetical protein CHX27_13040 [Flavobacterium aurantiibacter]
MKFIIKLVISAISVLLLSYLLPGVRVTDLQTALIVALVLSLLNMFVKPILLLVTLPITIFTLGIFLLFINTIILLICDVLVDGFTLNNFLAAFVFSLCLSFIQSLTSKLL